MNAIKNAIRDIPDFPKKGIVFKDITPLLNQPKLFQKVVDIFYSRYEGDRIQKVIGIESRGFILGSVLAYRLEAGFSIVRKTGKLPYKTIKKSYDLEYGTDHLEMHEDSIEADDRVLIVDDLLATGGTCNATIQLVEELKGKVVGCAFLIELSFLKGREKLKNYDVFSIVQYA
ncbi:MAG: adenine phosphoribosyltransferase [Deltaproteobacteria bacterium]|nr:adenine phosphoribosyltransferase [Deltaproteobacteria bacterium]